MYKTKLLGLQPCGISSLPRRNHTNARKGPAGDSLDFETVGPEWVIPYSSGFPSDPVRSLPAAEIVIILRPKEAGLGVHSDKRVAYQSSAQSLQLAPMDASLGVRVRSVSVEISRWSTYSRLLATRAWLHVPAVWVNRIFVKLLLTDTCGECH